VKVTKGFDWQAHAGLREATVQAERELGRDGRVLIRASGTEPVLRVMVESRDAAHGRALAERLVEASRR
jgi:phosphoglucosamine mutase